MRDELDIAYCEFPEPISDTECLAVLAISWKRQGYDELNLYPARNSGEFVWKDTSKKRMQTIPFGLEFKLIRTKSGLIKAIEFNPYDLPHPTLPAEAINKAYLRMKNSGIFYAGNKDIPT